MNEPTRRPAHPSEDPFATLAGGATPSPSETRREPVFPSSTFVSAEPTSRCDPSPRIDGYEIIGRIGRGGMGEVLEARQISLNRKVAIKILFPELAADPGIIERFDREAATLARLMHPNIVTIFERGRSGSLLYFIMEYVEGGEDGRPRDLRQLLQRGAVDEATVKKLLLQVADALEFAHGEGVVHRDVKPSNIMIDRRGNAKVADFGIASVSSAVDAALTGSMAMLGTLDYMAPEQRRDAGTVDHRADIYSTGVLLYELLTGELPMGAYAPPSSLAPIRSDWDAIVARAMHPRPEGRFARMSDLSAAIERVSPKVKTPVEPAPPSVLNETDEPLALARAHFESSKGEGSIFERFEHAEHAGLILASFLKRNFSPRAESFLKEVNRSTVRLARRIAKDALESRDLSIARKYLEWLADCDPDSRDSAHRLMTQIDAGRTTILEEARQFQVAGQLDTAILRLVEAARRFPNDADIQSRLNSLRRAQSRLRSFLDEQFPTLETQMRYCQIAQEIESMRSVGIDVPALTVLANQATAMVRRADRLVRRAQEHSDAGRRDRAEKKLLEAIAIVSDHAEARRFHEDLVVRGREVEELTGRVESLLAAGQFFTARRLIRRTKDASGRNSRQKARLQRAEEGCQKSNRYLVFLLFAVLGTALTVASGPLTELVHERINTPNFQRVGPFSAKGQRLAFMFALRTCVASLILLPLAAGLFRRIQWLFLMLAPLTLLAIGPAYDLCEGVRGAGANAANGLAALALTLVVLACVWSLAGGPQIVSAVTVLVVGGMTGACWPEPVKNVLWLSVALTAAGWAAVLGLSTGWRRLPLFVAASLVFVPLWDDSAEMWFRAILFCAILIPAGVLAVDRIHFRSIFGVSCVVVASVFANWRFVALGLFDGMSLDSIRSFQFTFWLVIWSAILGSMAAQLRDRLSFRLNILDRLGLALTGRSTAKPLSASPP